MNHQILLGTALLLLSTIYTGCNTSGSSPNNPTKENENKTQNTPRIQFISNEQKYLKISNSDFYDYARENQLLGYIKLIKDPGPWGEGNQTQLLENCCESTKKLVKKAWDDAKNKSKSKDLQNEIVSNIRNSIEFKTNWESSKQEFLRWLESELGKLQATKQNKWYYSEFALKGYDISSELLTLNGPSGAEVKTTLSIQRLEQLRNSYNSRWREKKIKEDSAIIIQKTYKDGHTEYAGASFEETKRAKNDAIRKYRNEQIPLYELGDYIKPVTRRFDKDTVIALVDNSRNVIVSWVVK